MNIHISKRRSKSLPKSPRDYCNDTVWGHAIFRKEYSKVVWERFKLLRYFLKYPKWTCTYNKYSKSLFWDVKY